jgi:hypothetical protein
MVDSAAFEGNKSIESDKIKSDDDGILLFAVKLKERPNGILLTRLQYARSGSFQIWKLPGFFQYQVFEI